MIRLAALPADDFSMPEYFTCKANSTNAERLSSAHGPCILLPPTQAFADRWNIDVGLPEKSYSSARWQPPAIGPIRYLDEARCGGLRHTKSLFTEQKG